LNEDAVFEYKDRITPVGDAFQNTINRYLVKQYSDQTRLANVYEDPGLIKFQANYDLAAHGGWKLTL
jgi:hypothetical protein